MTQDDKSAVQVVTKISSRTFYSSILIFASCALFSRVFRTLLLRWTWLGLVSTTLLVIAELLLVISWITPGVLLILGKPQYTHAWLRVINPVVIQNKPWEELRYIQKVLICFWAILLSGFTLLGVVGFSLQYLRK